MGTSRYISAYRSLPLERRQIPDQSAPKFPGQVSSSDLADGAEDVAKPKEAPLIGVRCLVVGEVMRTIFPQPC